MSKYLKKTLESKYVPELLKYRLNDSNVGILVIDKLNYVNMNYKLIINIVLYIYICLS